MLNRRNRWITEIIESRKDILDKMPYRAGVYVIYVNDPSFQGIWYLCYIGSTESIANRMKQHIKALYDRKGDKPIYLANKDIGNKLGFSVNGCSIKIKYKITNKLGDWLMKEYRLIYKLKPIGNNKLPFGVKHAKNIL